MSLAVMSNSFEASGARKFVERPVRLWQAFGVALTLEFLLLASFVAWMLAHPSKPALEVTPITIEVSEEQPVPPKEEPPPPPLPKVQPAPVLPPQPVPVVVSRTVPTQSQKPDPVIAPPPEAPPVVSTPSAFTTTSPPPVPVAPAPTAPPTISAPAPSTPSADYVAKLTAAVQAAVIFPAAAQAMNFQGRARVEFTLRDSVSSQARVIVSSGMGMVDRAAVAAVLAASYPQPPAGLQGKEERYQLWVGFNYR